MAWEYDFIEEIETPCPCGNGKIVKTKYRKSDDWNRIEFGEYGEKLICGECSQKYHLEKLTINYYLVPNGKTLQKQIVKKDFNFNFNFYQHVIANYSIIEIQEIILEMRECKYSTRLVEDKSKDILYCHRHFYKSCKLSKIIEKLEKCILNYNQEEWTKETFTAFIEQEKKKIKVEEEKTNETLKHCIKINFKD